MWHECSYTSISCPRQRPGARTPTACRPGGGIHQRQEEVYEECGGIYKKIWRETAGRVGHSNADRQAGVLPRCVGFGWGIYGELLWFSERCEWCVDVITHSWHDARRICHRHLSVGHLVIREMAGAVSCSVIFGHLLNWTQLFSRDVVNVSEWFQIRCSSRELASTITNIGLIFGGNGEYSWQPSIHINNIFQPFSDKCSF